MRRRAAMDFQKFNPATRVYDDVVDVDERLSIFAECSPLTHVSQGDPPALLLHGGQDEGVPIRQSRVFRDRMLQVGSVCELVEYADVGHAWKTRPGEADIVGAWFDRWLVTKQEE